LTGAELSVLRMIVGGMSGREIAFALDISETMVDGYANALFDKLGVADRTAAAAVAVKRGLVKTEL